MTEDLSEYHRLLNLDPAGHQGETLEYEPARIRSAFRKKARSVHPDLHPEDPDAAAKFARVRKAFSVLIALAEYRRATGREEQTPGPVKEAGWRMERLEKGGLDLIYHLALEPVPDPAELVVPCRVEKRCPDCRGRGRIKGKGLSFLWTEERLCGRCSGQGKSARVGQVRTRLPLSMEGPFCLRFKGRGRLDPGTGQRGDLILLIRPQGPGFRHDGTWEAGS